MPASYNRVNFVLRPAKAAERRMIVEVCSRLGSFSNLLGFRYIGLGSPFFNDFALFHRRYGMRNLICIERELQDQNRFLFNRPFDCIQMYWGESTDVLPRMQWTGIPTIVWMDYDDPINEEILSDLGTIISQVEPGSMVLFTIQSVGKAFKSEKRSAFEGLQDAIADFIPIDATPTDMRGKTFQRLIQRIVTNELHRKLTLRNSGVPSQSEVRYKQLFNMTYADGVRMTTIGGMIYRADQEQQVTDCTFSDFGFLTDSESPHEIELPVLTYKELSKLSSKLPYGNPDLSFLSQKEIDAYRKLYRYYPTFVETDL